MNSKNMMSCESAISAVVSAVLLLGIFVSLMTVVYVEYVPEWKTSSEQSHMSDVMYDMAGMKNEIDMLSVYARTEPSMVLSRSIPVRMGGGSLPIINYGRSSGKLAVNDAEFDMNIVATTPGLTYNSNSFLRNLGTVSYDSDNNYFVDQRFTYENGALLLSQKEYSLMRLEPQVYLKRTDGDNITMEINAIELSGQERSVSSNSIQELHFTTNGSDSLYWEEALFTDMTITVETSYPVSWVTFFEKLADDGDIDPSEYSISSNDSTVVFYLVGNPGEDIKLNVTKTIFDVHLNLLA